MKNNNGSVLSHSCRGLKIRVTAIVFVIFLLSAQTLAQVQSSNRVKLVTPISDEQQINTILEEVVQGTRSNESERIATFIGSQSERAQVRNQLADAFKQGRDINRNIASVFSFDSMRVTIAGDSAQVMCLVGDQIEKKASTTLLLKKEMGRWYISHSSDIVERIADFVKSNGFPSRQPSNSEKSLMKTTTRIAQNSATLDIVGIVESNHALIPQRYYTDPDKWLITRSDAQTYVGKTLFSSLSEIEYVPLAVSNGYVSDDVTFVLDEQRHRIVFAEGSSNWTKSYGDWPGDYSFLDSRGMKALKMADGTVNIFVSEASKGEIAQLRYDHATGVITYLRSIKGPLQIPVDVDVDAWTSTSTWPNYSIWVADKGLGGIVELDKDGNLLTQLTQYSFNGITYSLDNVTKVSHDPTNLIGFIDRNQMAFVVLNLGNLQVLRMNKFSSPSNLTNLGRTFSYDWVVTDANLNEVHLFQFFGQYLCSYKIYNSNFSLNPSVFSAVNGVNLLASPIAFGGGGAWNNYSINALGMFSGNSFLSASGFGYYLPGVDIVNFTSAYQSSFFDFEYDLVGANYLTAIIYNQSNAEVLRLHNSQYLISGHMMDYPSYAQLGGQSLGTYTLRLSVTPSNNSVYGEYQQNPVQINYAFALPVAGNISGLTSATSGQSLTWNMNVTSGSGNFSYQWFRQEFGSSAWSSVSTSSMLTQQMGSQSFTVRCDVKDILNNRTTTFTQFVSHITLSGTLSSDEIWPGGSSIMLTGQITIPTGLNLTIQAGATVFFPQYTSLIVNGKLTVNGSSGIYTIFRGPSPGSWYVPGDWGSIVLDGAGSAGSSLNYVTMMNGTQIQITNTSNVTIQNSVLQNSINGIYAYNCSSGSILNNTITNPRDHGINLIVSPMTCNQNTITKASGNANYHSGGAIICQSGSYGDIWKNTISGFNWGVGAIWGSSPQFRNVSNAGVNNNVTNCLYSVMTYQYSYPTIAPDPESHYYYRYQGNSFSGSQYYDFYADTYSGAEGYGAFWGGGPSYWLGTGCYFYYEYFPQIAGGGPELTFQKDDQRDAQAQTTESSNQHLQLPAQQAINQPNGKVSLLDGVELRSNGKFREAKDFFMSYIANNPKNQAAYVELFNCYSDETAKDITDFFSSPPKAAAKEHGLLLSYLHLKKGSKDQAKQVNQNIMSARSNARLTTRAKLNNFYSALFNDNDRDGASSILDEVLDKPELSTPLELSTAQSALETFVSVEPGQANRFKKQTQQLTQVMPIQFELSDNYPNPFNPSTTIRYAIPEANLVTLKVFDVLGKQVAMLVNEDKPIGFYEVQFDASHYSSGIYFYQIQAGTYRAVKKMILMK
jgi:hypothetical protein